MKAKTAASSFKLKEACFSVFSECAPT